MKNPHNRKNSTDKVDEKEALKQFIENLKRTRPSLTNEKVIELAAIFHEEVEKNKNKDTLISSGSLPKSTPQPKMTRSEDAEPEVRNLKLDKIENELGIEDLESTFNYYTHLADNDKNSTVTNRS